MGILEIHFHESDLNFSPSMSKGSEADESSSDDGTILEPDTDSNDGGPGALLALGVLIVIGVLVGLRRRRNGGGDGDDSHGENEKISISA